VKPAFRTRLPRISHSVVALPGRMFAALVDPVALAGRMFRRSGVGSETRTTDADF